MSTSSASRRRRRSRFRLLRRLQRWTGAVPALSWILPGAGIALGLLVLLAVFGLSAGRNQLSLARSAFETARSSMASHDVEGTTAALDDADAAVKRAGTEATKLPLSLLSPVPFIGSPVKAQAAGVTAGHEAVAAGRILNAAAGSFPTSQTSSGVDGHDLSGFHAAAQRSADALSAANAHLVKAKQALDGPAGALLPPVSAPARSMLVTVNDAQHQLGSIERGLQLLSRLSAPDTDARILLLSQDSMELRATGGFIGSFGVFRFAHGTVALERYDSFEALPEPQPPMAAPAALAQALSRPWDVSNSNWWPDFPTSARTATEMFKRQGGGDVAGVIAVDEAVMSRLVGALGPIQLAGYSKPVTEDGFASRVVYEVELKRPQDNPRKKFLIDLSNEVFHRLFNLNAAQLPAVAGALGHAAGAGDLQVYFTDPAWQAEIAPSLTGALPVPSPGGDFLALVESNLTAGKANGDLVRTVDYHVTKRSGGRLEANLEINYANGVKTAVNPYYNGFLRVYVPRGSVLADDSQGDAEDATDGPYTVISSQVYVEPDGHEKLSFTYTLPPGTAPGGAYHLTWLRQPGTPADSLTATVAKRAFEADPAQRRLGVFVRL